MSSIELNVAWALGGVALGVAHARGIWRSTRRPSAWMAVLAIVRLAMVGGGLAVAAILGAVLPTAGGWALGFGLATLIALWRSGSPGMETRD
jgi:hypothetical protein